MKKVILTFLVLISLSTSVLADGLTATLQQGDVMTPFYGVDAFKQAYEAANDGAVITLSSGKFNDVAAIEKSISIIGAYAFDVNSSETTFLYSLKVKADNVKIEGVFFSGTVTLDSISDCHIKRCWIQAQLTATASHTNTMIDQCVVKDDAAIAKGYNYSVKNTTIGYFSGMNTSDNIAFITNCYIWTFIKYNYSSYKQPIAIYKNNIIGLDIYSASSQAINFSSPSEFYYNYFDRYNSYSSTRETYYTPSFYAGCVNKGNTSSPSYPYKSSLSFSYPYSTTGCGYGEDGTPRGIKGGSGFSYYPSIPRVTSKQIDTNSNSEGEISVKITVKAEK